MTKEVLDKMYENHDVLMEKIHQILWGKDEEEKKKYFNSETHYYIRKNCWEILLPLPKEEWSEKVTELSLRYEKVMPWPQYSSYNYTMDVLCPPFIPHICLYFGYAVMEDGTVFKSAFFHWHKMVKYQEMPQGIVMDPFADMHGIKPKYYVGSCVDKEDLENFLLTRKGNILESYAKRKNKKEHEERLHDTYMQAYFLQMAHEPNYFPKKLKEFAKKEGLWFPEEQKSSN